MLAIKRALSIVLSTLLAMPTVTWAKSQPKRAPAQQVAAKSASTSVHVKHQERMPLARKGKGKVAKNNGNSQTPLVFIDGQPYEVSEIPGRNGRVKSRTASGPGYSEMIVDKNDDGFADVIQVTKGDVTTTAMSPFFGRFRRIEVERKLKNGTYKAILFMSHDQKRYEMVDQRVYPKGKFGAETTTAGAHTVGISDGLATADQLGAAITADKDARARRTQDGVESILNGSVPFRGINFQESTGNDTRMNQCEDPIVIDSMNALDRALALALRENPRWNMEQVLQCQLNKFQKLLMDDTCRTEPWRDSIQGMNWGLARVMSSYYDFKDQPPRPAPGRYLQCLSNQGWGESASSLNRYVWEAFRNVTTRLMEAGLTQADFTALFSQVSSTPEGCTIPNEYEGAVSHRRINLDDIARRMAAGNQRAVISCSASSDHDHRAQYDETTRQVRVFSKANTIVADTPFCRGRDCYPVDAYAATFFHELTHASGFGERHEAIVENVEKCCSVSERDTTSRDAAACDSTRQSARIAAAMQTNQAALSSLIPSYNSVAATVYREFNPNGSYLLDDYNRAMVTVVQDTADGVSEALHRCETNRDSAARATCVRDAFYLMNSAMRTRTVAFFDQTCPLYAQLAQADGTTGLGQARNNPQTCGNLKNQLLAEFDRGNQSTGTVAERLAVINYDQVQTFAATPQNIQIPDLSKFTSTLSVGSLGAYDLNDIGKLNLSSISSGTRIGGINISAATSTSSSFGIYGTIGDTLYSNRRTNSTQRTRPIIVLSDSLNPRSMGGGSLLTIDAPLPTAGMKPWGTNFGVPDVASNVGVQPPISDTTKAESRTIYYNTDPERPVSLPREIVFEPVQIDLPPIQPIVIEQPQVVQQPRVQGRLSSPTVNSTTTTVARSQPVSSTPTTIAASNPSAVVTTQPQGRLSSPTVNPTTVESTGLNSSGLVMPSSSNTEGTLGQPSASRPDIQSGRVSPGAMYVNSFVNGATRTLSAIGDAVAGRANATELNTAARRANERQPASQPRVAEPPVAASLGAGVTPNSPQGLALATASTVVIAGAPTAAPERSIAVRGGPGENSVVVNPQSQIQRTAAKPRERGGDRGRDGDDRNGSRVATRGGGPGGGNGAPGADRGRDDGDDQRDDGSKAERDRQVRALASAPVPAAASRSGQRGNFNSVQDATGMQVYIGRVNTEEMPRLLVNRDFVKKMRSVGVAVMDRNNNRIGAPPPAPVMELCQSRQRYVLEGTCR